MQDDIAGSSWARAIYPSTGPFQTKNKLEVLHLFKCYAHTACVLTSLFHPRKSCTHNLSYANCFTQLLYTQLFTHSSFTQNSYEHNCFAHNSFTQNSFTHTHNSFTQPFTHCSFTYSIVTHTHAFLLTRRAFTHTTLSHRSVTHTHGFTTQSVFHHLLYLSPLSYPIFGPVLCCLEEVDMWGYPAPFFKQASGYETFMHRTSRSQNMTQVDSLATDLRK